MIKPSFTFLASMKDGCRMSLLVLDTRTCIASINALAGYRLTWLVAARVPCLPPASPPTRRLYRLRPLCLISVLTATSYQHKVINFTSVFARYWYTCQIQVYRYGTWDCSWYFASINKTFNTPLWLLVQMKDALKRLINVNPAEWGWTWLSFRFASLLRRPSIRPYSKQSI
jgi:hypothetical protein